MVGLQYDFLANPIGAVRSTFKEAMAAGNDPTFFEGKDWGAVDVFQNFIYHQNGLSQVPILDQKTAKWIQPNTLVRFRGMIQDMYGNEIYVGAYKDGSVWRTNKFIDYSEVPIQPSMDMRMWQRNLFHCVPVPGQNSWIESSSEVTMKRIMDRASQHREKRVRQEDEAVDSMDLGDTVNEIEGSPSAKKRREDGHPSEPTHSKDSVSEATASVLPEIPRDPVSCIVKIYDTPESDFKLNEVFEFIGIFTLDSEHQDSYDEFEDGFKDKTQEVGLPPAVKVPHIHCFIHRKLAIDDFIPKPSKFEPMSHVVKEIRESLLRNLTDLLGHDSLAAQFVLLHLLSKVQYRSGDYAVGKFSVNLTGFNKENASQFGALLNLAVKDVLPFSNYLPITIESLNAASFSPQKDHEANRLTTGLLQLADGSHLILDETKLDPGTLNSVGVANAKSLKNLFELQKVYYDFKYSETEMLSDIQLLVLSEGKSNLCPADLVLPFRPSSAGCSSEASPESLDAWRWYLATLRSLPHNIDTELQNAIENDLVRAKQVDQNLEAQDFHRLLTMARLVCMSYGESSLSWERWEMVKELERQRRERLS